MREDLGTTVRDELLDHFRISFCYVGSETNIHAQITSKASSVPLGIARVSPDGRSPSAVKTESAVASRIITYAAAVYHSY